MQIERTDIFMAGIPGEVYRVGGSVRDELLGVAAKDADYMVRGIPLRDLPNVLSGRMVALGYNERMAITPLRLRQGGQFGWRASARGLGSIEIALPRAERSVGPGRAMDVMIDPTLSVGDDAMRRDFTFNALYKRIITGPEVPRTLMYGRDGRPIENILDPTGRGLHDLEHMLVQTTHADSFGDDPLRTLRALRFVARLGYDLTAETREQMVRHADAVSGLTENGHTSGTVLDELAKILMGDNAVKALRLARDAGVLQRVLPELAPMIGFDQGSRYHDLTTDEHTFKALETAIHVGIDAPLRVRMALLFHDAGKPEAAWVGKDGRKHYYAQDGSKRRPGALRGQQGPTEDHEIVGERIWRKAAERLNVGRELREDVATLIRNHMVPLKTKNLGSRVRRMRVEFGDDLLRDLILHRMCDITGKDKTDDNYMQHLAKMERLRQEAQAAGIPASVGDLGFKGGDLKAQGVSGRRIGEIMRRVLDEVVVDPSELRLSSDWQMQRAVALAP